MGDLAKYFLLTALLAGSMLLSDAGPCFSRTVGPAPVMVLAAAPTRHEIKAGDTWPNLRRELERLQVGTFEGSAGFFRKRTALTPAQRAIFKKLQISEPPEMQEIRPAAKAS